MGSALGMSAADWIVEYERLVADLPPPVPMAQWTPEEARAHAEAAFHEAPEALRRETLFNHARRQGRAAKSPRRLAGIRQREPEVADMIEADLEWMEENVAGFSWWPFRVQIEHWYHVTTRDNSEDGLTIEAPEDGTPKKRGRRKGEPKTARGNKPGRPALRAAAFMLMDWRQATGQTVAATLYGSSRHDHGIKPHSPSDAVGWLADELAALDRRLGQASEGDDEAYERLAFREIVAWQDATTSGAHP